MADKSPQQEERDEQVRRWPVVKRARKVALLSGFGSTLAAATAVLAWFLSANPSPALVVSINIITGGLLVLAASGSYFVLRAPPTSGTWTALLTLTATPVPGIAAGISVLVYLWNPISGYRSGSAITAGVVIASLIWLFIANIGRVYTQAERANPRAYGELIVRLDDLLARVDGLSRPAGSDPPYVVSARSCVRRHLKAVDSELRVAGWRSRAPQWLHATGYVDAWNRIHRAEEALIMLESLPTVKAALEQDKLRLDDSAIHNQERLQSLLSQAEHYLGDASTEAEGRADFRKVRHAINEYRDSRVDGLVRARNGLMRTILVTGLIAYMLLGLAMLMGVSSTAVGSAAGLSWSRHWLASSNGCTTRVGPKRPSRTTVCRSLRSSTPRSHQVWLVLRASSWWPSSRVSHRPPALPVRRQLPRSRPPHPFPPTAARRCSFESTT